MVKHLGVRVDLSRIFDVAVTNAKQLLPARVRVTMKVYTIQCSSSVCLKAAVLAKEIRHRHLSNVF